MPKAETAAATAPYHLNLQVAIHNLGQEPQSVGYRLDGPTGAPLEGWWYSTKLNPNWEARGPATSSMSRPAWGTNC